MIQREERNNGKYRLLFWRFDTLKLKNVDFAILPCLLCKSGLPIFGVMTLLKLKKR